MAINTRDLHQRLERVTERLEKIDLLNAACVEIHENDPHEAMALAEQALRLSKASRDKERLSVSHASIAACHERLSKHADALRHLDKALTLCREIDNRGIESRVLQQIGIVHTNTGAYPAAVEHLEASLVRARERGDEMREALVHNSLGVVYNSISHTARALGHYQECRRICEKIDNRNGLIWANNNIGTIYLAIDDVPKAYEYYLKNETLVSEEGSNWLQLVLGMNLATTLFRLGRIEEAHAHVKTALDLSRAIQALPNESYLLHLLSQFSDDVDSRLNSLMQALEIARAIDDPGRIGISASIGVALMNAGRHQEGLHWLTTTLQESESVGDMATSIKAHEALSSHYEQTGDATLALRHHKRHTELREIVRGEAEQRTIVAMEMRAEIERGERDREILRLEKLRLEQEMAHKNAELTAMALNLIEKNQFLQALKNEMAEVTQATGLQDQSAVQGLLRKVDGNLHVERDWKAFEAQFESVHQDFLRKVATLCPALTRSELKVCALLKLNLSSKEVADLLSTSIRTAENHRYRIRKKLDLADDINVSTFFAGL